MWWYITPTHHISFKLDSIQQEVHLSSYCKRDHNILRLSPQVKWSVIVSNENDIRVASRFAEWLNSKGLQGATKL